MSEIYTFQNLQPLGSALVFETEVIITPLGMELLQGETLPNGVYIYFIEAPCEVNGRRMIKERRHNHYTIKMKFQIFYASLVVRPLVFDITDGLSFSISLNISYQ